MRISDWSSDLCSSDLAGDMPRAESATSAVSGQPCRPASRRRAAYRPGKPSDRAVHAVRVCRVGLCIGFRQADPAESHHEALSDGAWYIIVRHRGGLLFRSEEHTSELQSLMRISY